MKRTMPQASALTADGLEQGGIFPRCGTRMPDRGRGDPIVHAVINDARSIVNARSVPIVAAGTEFLLLAAAIFGAGSLYHWAVFGQMPFVRFYLGAALVLSLMFVLPCGLSRDYSVTQLLERKLQFRSVLVHWNLAFSLFVFALFMVHATDFYSRGSLVAQYGAGLATALFARLAATVIVAAGLKSKRIHGRNVVIVGEAARVDRMVRRLQRSGKGAEVRGTIVLPPHPALAARRSVTDIPDIAAETQAVVRTLRELMRRTVIDEIVIELRWSDADRIQALMEALTIVPATVHLAPDPGRSWTRNPILAHVGAVPTLRLVRAPLTWRDLVLKRVFDIVVASTLLVLGAPLFLAAAIAVKLESAGPVFFRQRRLGFNQRDFRVLKFRTMTTLDDGPQIRQATRNDKRITRVGRFLRSTNLDELPQLFNVLAGHMSLVGPRPHAVAHDSEYARRIQIYALRHKVKPGITGLAQINGLRGETDTLDKMTRRVEHDLLYIENWSLFADLRILFMTLFSLRSYRNAY
jgi:Undecaprenyl-phosphate glucose phosphotransferase